MKVELKKEVFCSKADADEVIGEDRCLDFSDGQRLEVDSFGSSTAIKKFPNSTLTKNLFIKYKY